MKNGSKKKWKLNRLRERVRPCLQVFLLIVLAAFFVINASGCGRATYQYQTTDIAMGTMLSVNVYTNQPEGEKLPGRLKDRIIELEEQELSWRVETSDIGRINAAAGSGTAVSVSLDLQKDLEELLEVSARSNGAFDFTIGAVSRLWNIDEGALKGSEDNVSAKIPTPDEIAEVLAVTGYEKLADGIILPAGMSIDLGAVGKGIACDRLGEYLEQEKVTGAVISIGGSILTYGSKPDGSPWQVGIVNPHDTSALLGTLTLTGEWYVSTSGDYERFIEVDGEVYHHIIDPATGYPADSGLKSVTILCKSGLLSDALSTACFVLGAQEGMKLAESYGAEALFVDDAGNIYMTEQMKKIFKET